MEEADTDASSQYDSEDESSLDEYNLLEEDNIAEQPADTYGLDPNIVPMHTYLGSDMEELHGRTLFDEESVQELPMIIQPGFVGVPGQTLPLTFSHPHTISMMRNIIEGNRTFGIISLRIDEDQPHPVLSHIGTTAEVYEYGDETESFTGFKIKAKVRQRFKVLDTRRQIDGNIVGKVSILPEKKLSESLHSARLISLDRYRIVPVSSTVASTQNYVYKKQYKIPFTVWPSWVHQQYDIQLLSERVHRELENSVFMGKNLSKTVIPRDPIELSYWVIQNTPLEDKHRLVLLSIDSPIQRLRAELSILQKYGYLCCRSCSQVVANQTAVFAMSQEGPQGAYVNPHGHVHETVTLTEARGMKVTTQPSNDFSWFPGYAWSIVECSSCRSHMGWLFTAANRRLNPQKFWGLSRGSLKPKLNIDLLDGKFPFIL